MIKKAKIWSIILIFTLIVVYIPKWCNSLKDKRIENEKEEQLEIENNISLEIDPSFIDTTLYYKSIFKKEKNPDVVIADKFKNENYEKIENGIYTPIIVLEKKNFLSKDLSFIEDINNEKYINYIKLFKDIDKDIFNKSKNIYLPSENNMFYQSVLNLIIYSLNDFKEPIDIEFNELKIKAISIMNKCSSYNTIGDLKNLDNNSYLYVIPETYYKEIYSQITANYITPTRTISYSSNLYIKKDNKNFIIDKLQNSKMFFDSLNYRNKFIKYDLRNGYTSSKSINIINIKEDLLYKKTIDSETKNELEEIKTNSEVKDSETTTESKKNIDKESESKNISTSSKSNVDISNVLANVFAFLLILFIFSFLFAAIF